jgi:succinate--hydroxymethylglutarate CoA-transferase
MDCKLTVSGYGAGGPHAKRAGYDVIAAAEAGLLHITGESNGPPTKPGVGLTDMCTGLYLHGAILAALHTREKTGLGQKIDASLFETQVSVLANVAMSWLNAGQEAKRWGTQHPSIVPYEAFKTKDAYLVLGAVNNRQFGVLCDRLGRGELAQDSRFATNKDRVQNREELKDILDDLLMEMTTDEWLTIFEGSGMPYGPINNLEQVFSHPQTLARSMIEVVPHKSAVSGSIKVLGKFSITDVYQLGAHLWYSGIPVKFSGTKPSIRQKPPSLGEHTGDILEGIGLLESDVSKLREEHVI